MEQNGQAPSQEMPPSYDGLLQIPPPPPPQPGRLRRVFMGQQGLRAGWSTFLFIVFTVIFSFAIAPIMATLTGVNIQRNIKTITPSVGLIIEIIQLLPVVAAIVLMALIEKRRVTDYFLSGRRAFSHFFTGAAVGFIALSVLAGALAWGGWLHFGPVALSGASILGYGSVWGLVFLLTGLFEEGSFRCYLQFTFTRGINFWWALGIVGAACVDLVLRHAAHAAWGIYILALLGLLPCLWLHVQRTPGSNFWQAAWATSTLFGFIHVTNKGENWIGIFSAAAIGLVFCLSIWVTGSAWWAIGCHAAWDWAQTFFYGTPDSGLVAKGHFLTTAPASNVFWSGGTDGPEGSILILGILVLIVIALLVIYGRRCALTLPQPPVQETAG